MSKHHKDLQKLVRAQKMRSLRRDPDFEARRLAGLRQSKSVEGKRAVVEAASELLRTISELPEEARQARIAAAPRRVQTELLWREYLLKPRAP